ncbi:protein kinase [Bacillus thuringiensis]|uniref:Protein kinase n=1 Tax=Bacillus thuringiensis serovar andalousiensis TaxID=257985 RepID=A0A6H0TIU2_BACTU|nr:protein kinase [Bacillus thuringiensis]QIW21091.1 protein kinase [Bacillus thuringiensis serovar andalousiensis]
MDFIQNSTFVYGLGLCCGLWSKEEVIQWCDKVIEMSDSPPYEIIEISFMSKAKIDDIEGKLFKFSRTVNKEYTAKLALSVIHEKLVRNELTIEESIKCTTRLLINIGLYWEDDSYELAKNGVHFDLVDVVNVYIEILEVYSKYFCEFENLYFKVMGNEWD